MLGFSYGLAINVQLMRNVLGALLLCHQRQSVSPGCLFIFPANTVSVLLWSTLGYRGPNSVGLYKAKSQIPSTSCCLWPCDRKFCCAEHIASQLLTGRPHWGCISLPWKSTGFSSAPLMHTSPISSFKLPEAKTSEEQISQGEGVKMFSVTSHWQLHQHEFCGAGMDVNAFVTV